MADRGNLLITKALPCRSRSRRTAVFWLLAELNSGSRFGIESGRAASNPSCCRFNRSRRWCFHPMVDHLAAASDASSQIVVWDLARTTREDDSRRVTYRFSAWPSRRTAGISLRERRETGRRFMSGTSKLVASVLCWKGRRAPVAAVAFSPDGAMLATAAMFEKGVRLWDMSSGRSCRVIARPFVRYDFGRFLAGWSRRLRQRAMMGWSVSGALRRVNSVPYWMGEQAG